MVGRRFCARAFSSCGKRGPLFIAVRGPLTIAASLVAEHRLQTRRLSSCGSRGQLLRGMWDHPRPGLEPVSPALADRFSTTAPPGKPQVWSLNHRTARKVPKGACFLSTYCVPSIVLDPFKAILFNPCNHYSHFTDGENGGPERFRESSQVRELEYSLPGILGAVSH